MSTAVAWTPWDENASLDLLSRSSTAAAAALDRLALDASQDGQRTLGDACRQAGLDVPFVLQFVRDRTLARRSVPASGWDEQPLALLVAHIERTHHRFTHEALVQIDRLAHTVLAAVAPVPLDRDRLLAVLRELEASLLGHLLEERHLLFPYIERLSRPGAGSDGRNRRRRRQLAVVIGNLRIDQAASRRLLGDLVRMTDQFSPPPGASPALRSLYALLAELGNDITQHVALEARVLFPRALAL